MRCVGVIREMSRPARGAWIEMLLSASVGTVSERSRPARGAWIEMPIALNSQCGIRVAPRTGRVD